jgi:hypothetical protein
MLNVTDLGENFMYYLYNKINISRAPRPLSVSIKVIIGSNFMWYVYK